MHKFDKEEKDSAIESLRVINKQIDKQEADKRENFSPGVKSKSRADKYMGGSPY